MQPISLRDKLILIPKTFPCHGWCKMVALWQPDTRLIFNSKILTLTTGLTTPSENSSFPVGTILNYRK